MSMDAKGITWAANIYQRFETMCLEVEEIMYQDSVKFMENQVQTVGASVKKFYSDIMDDLIPPNSLDPGKVVTSDFILEQFNDVDSCKKAKPTLKKEPLKFDIGQLRKRSKAPVSVEKNHAADPGRVVTSELILEQLNDVDSCKKAKPMMKKEPLKLDIGQLRKHSKAPVSVEKKHAVVASTVRINGVEISSRTYAVESCEKGDRMEFLGAGVVTDEKIIKDSAEGPGTDVSAGHTACPDEILERNSETSNQENPATCLASSESTQAEIAGGSEDATETSDEDIPDMPVQDSSSLTRISESELAHDCGWEKGLSPAEDFTTVSQDISWDSSSVSFGASSMYDYFGSDVHNDDFFYSDHGGIDSSGKANLEESCIFVNQEELQSVAVAPGKSRPYKKKIRDVLSSRKMGSRAREYKQLAAQFADNVKFTDELGPTSAMSASPVKSLAGSDVHGQGESEWELL